MDGIGPRAPEPGDSWRVTTGGPRGTRMLRWSKGHTGVADPDGATQLVQLIHMKTDQLLVLYTVHRKRSLPSHHAPLRPSGRYGSVLNSCQAIFDGFDF